MTIDQIKQELSILTVLTHYGLQVNANGMLCCPFHEDQKASMKVYAATNTVYCFAGSCEVEHLDQIDFILRKEGISKHESILKAKSLCHPTGSLDLFNPPSPKRNAMPPPNPAIAFKSYHKSLHNHKLAQEYCESRCLDWRLLEVGYKSRKSSDKWGRGCIIFPLLNASGDIVSLYGRGITGSSHFYQTNRSGLYPGYPSKTAKVLILFESVIDAATLQPLDLGMENCELLALYGTNGLTAEHIESIKGLSELEEIIFAFDGDAAGMEATESHLRTLNRLHPKAKLSQLLLAEGEDVNSLAVADADGERLFKRLLLERKVLSKGEEKTEKVVEEKAAAVAKLDTNDAHNLVYTTTTARYYIKGGIRCSTKDMGHMKVTLVVESGQGKKSRNGLDLYEDRQIERIARHVSERLGLRADLVELDLHGLVDELDDYRKMVQTSGSNGAEKVVVASAVERAAYLSFWRSTREGSGLIEQIDNYLEHYGIIGEQNNRLLGFCIVSSSQMPEPLHGLIQGSSGSGKTHLLSALCGLIPEEYYIAITRATDPKNDPSKRDCKFTKIGQRAKMGTVICRA